MAKMSEQIDGSTKKWLLLDESAVINNQEGQKISHTINTAGTYLDRDIEVEIVPSVKGGNIVPEVTTEVETAPTATASVVGSFVSAEGVSSEKPASGVDGEQYLKISPSLATTAGNVAAVGSVTVDTAGWVDSDDDSSSNTDQAVTVTENVGGDFYIPVVTPTVTVGSVDVSDTTTSINPGNIVTVDKGTEGAYCISAQASGTITINGASYTSPAGYIKSTTGTTVNVDESSSEINGEDSKSEIYIPAATCTVTGGELSVAEEFEQAPELTLALGEEKSVADGVVSLSSTKPAEGFYIELNGSSDKITGTTIVSKAAVKDAHTAGYMEAKEATNVMASTSIAANVTVSSASKQEYLVINKGTLVGSAAADIANEDTYTEISDTSVIVPSEGNLYISEGYYPNTKISLATLVPNEASISTVELAKSNDIRTNTKVYDSNGILITGNMVDVTPTFEGGEVSGTATAVGTNVTFATSATEAEQGIYFDAKAVASRAVVTYDSSKVGYLDVSKGDIAFAAGENTNLESTKYYITSVEVPVEKKFSVENKGTLVVTSDEDSNDKLIYNDVQLVENGVLTKASVGVNGSVEAFTPVVEKVAVADVTVDAADGGVLASAPTSGAYVAIKTASGTTTGTATGEVTQSGYLASTDTIQSKEITVNVNESDVAYVKIKENEHTLQATASESVRATATSSADIEVSDEEYSAEGILNTAPAGAYLTITPSLETTKGSAVYQGGITVTKAGWIGTDASGLTTEASVEVNVTETQGAAKYIKIFTGEFDQ